MRITLDAPAVEVARAAQAALDLQGDHDGILRGPLTGMPETTARLVATVDGGSPCRVELRAEDRSTVPFFRWFVDGQSWVAAKAALATSADVLRAELDATEPPPARRRSMLVPPASFTPEQAARLGAIAAVAAITNFCGALLTQNGDAVTDAFHRSDRALGVALAIARVGVLVSIVAIALADRIGRRRLLLWCLAGACVANLVAGVSPSFEVFTGAQLLTRAFVNATLVVAAVAAVEDAPEHARAFAVAMFGLALGLGYGIAVFLLPLADLGNYGWRISFVVSALALLTLPIVARHLRETVRYGDVTRAGVRRGRLREVFDQAYGLRFFILAATAFLVNVFNAPSSQLTNRYLTREHDYSHSDVALFRTVTAGVPGVIGVVLAGRLAERRGRRPVALVGILLATIAQMVFFTSDGLALWIAPTISIVAAASAALAIGTLDGELFPTEVRGTSNGLILGIGVAGSAVGLVLATQLRDAFDGLGPAIALCGIAPLVAAIFLVPRLPETAGRRLDEVSPTER